MTADRKFKWWMIPVVVLLIAAVLTAVFWDTASVYLAPKTVLRSALDNTWEALEMRFAGNPLLLLGSALDESGLNTIQLELNAADDLLGEVKYQMTAQTQLAPKRVLAKGTAAVGGSTVDLSLYADENFAAVSSDSLLSSHFYGITYDTFPEDIRSNAILTFVLGQDTIGELEESVISLQETMSGGIVIPKVTEADIRMAMMGIYALKAEVGRDTVQLPTGEQECFRISFGATGAELLQAAELAKMELPFQLDPESVLTAAFCVADGTVIFCEMEMTGGMEDYYISLTPGLHPETDEIGITLRLPEADCTAAVSTIYNESAYTEQISLRQTADGAQMESVIHYSWNTDGALLLSRKDAAEERSVSCNLTATDEGFRLETDDIDGLLSILTDHEDQADNACVMTVGKGTDFDTPEYKNLDNWSLEDVLSLLGNIGSLLGLSM